MTLRNATLSHDDKSGKWRPTDDNTNRTMPAFDAKADAKAGGVLKKALVPREGSVKIQKENGRYQEARNYPRSADPKSSKG